jgi:thiamine-phosphate pyrophosphorylase
MASRGKPAEPRRPVPRLYLVTSHEPSRLADLLAHAMGAADIAAVLLRLPSSGKAEEIKALAPTVQDKGVALLLEGNAALAVETGADGAHLDGVDNFKAALASLKPDRIAGCGGLTTRHDAMVAGQAGADYVMFGEPGRSGRPSLEAITERVAWWAELFEVPCVGFAGSLDEVKPLAAAGADFVALDCVFTDALSCGAAVAEAARQLAAAETIAS